MTVLTKFSVGQRYRGTSVSHSTRSKAERNRYFSPTGSAGLTLGARHRFAGGHAALRHWDVGLADGAVNLGGPGWSFQAVRQ